LGWPQTSEILLISASQVTRITGVSHMAWQRQKIFIEIILDILVCFSCLSSGW
jgi:hypothetical protein